MIVFMMAKVQKTASLCHHNPVYRNCLLPYINMECTRWKYWRDF